MISSCIWGMQHSWVIKSLNCGPFRAFKGGGGGEGGGGEGGGGRGGGGRGGGGRGGGGGGGGGYLDLFSPAQKVSQPCPRHSEVSFS